MKPSARAEAVEPFFAMEILALAQERARRGERILRLEVGEPAGGAPIEALDALRARLGEDPFGYGPAGGSAELRSALADLCARWYGEPIDPARIVLTAGASGAFQLAFLAAFDAGARIGMAVPGYPCYRQIARALGLEPVSIETGPETRFQPTPELLERAGPLDGVVIASPANPTGSMIAPSAFAELLAWARANGVRVVSDEIYHGLEYEVEASCAAALDAEAITINSFSKFFGMTGWRLGWLALPSELAPAVERLAQNLFLCPSTPAQAAAAGALASETTRRGETARYRASRDLLASALRRAGVETIAPPDGAFYLYADLSAWTDDSLAFCKRALEDIGVAFTPGLDFDPIRGGAWARFSCAGADVEEAASRLEPWLLETRRRA